MFMYIFIQNRKYVLTLICNYHQSIFLIYDLIYKIFKRNPTVLNALLEPLGNNEAIITLENQRWYANHAIFIFLVEKKEIVELDDSNLSSWPINQWNVKGRQLLETLWINLNTESVLIRHLIGRMKNVR